MEIHDLGDGAPSVAVIGLVHGDEPCGETAIREVLTDSPDVVQPVRFIIANEAARDAGKRYLDHDLNRVFTQSSPTAASHEKQLAADILDAIEDCDLVLSLHSTQSTADVFALFSDLTRTGRAVCRDLPISVAVDCSAINQGALAHRQNVIDVECGRQQTDDAAANATRLIYAFLESAGVLPTGEAIDAANVGVFRPTASVPKPDGGARFIAENFQRVEAGEPYAVTDDGVLLRAEQAFYPVLMSTAGYADIIGYKADYKGLLLG